MTRDYDAVVIGSGVAGVTAAYELNAAGRRVALVDSGPFGGTCPLRGCDAKKVLFGAAEIVDTIRDMDGVSKGVDIDWPALVAFKDRLTKPYTERLERGLAEAGIDAVHGRAAFSAPGRLRVGADILTARHVVIATGSRPRALNIPGEEHVTTSDRFMEAASLPQGIVFIGGGYISFEFAHVAAAAGCQARILHRGAEVLAHFDRGMVAKLVEATEDRGIRVALNSEVVAVERAASGLVVRSAGGERYECGMVVHGAGRVADLEDLDPQAGGVELGRRGVAVNGFLQSVSNPAVYAAGDAAGSIQLTPVAVRQGWIAARNILTGNEARFDPRAVASAVFTVPILAAVGLTEEEARREGLDFEVKAGDTSSWYTARRVGLRHAGFKVITDRGSGRLLGAHLLGWNADEAINVFALAIDAGLPARRLKSVLWAYPSAGHDVQYMV